jgi:FEZ-like protein
MACGGELEFEAPLARFDVEDWTEFYEQPGSSPVADNSNDLGKPCHAPLVEDDDFCDASEVGLLTAPRGQPVRELSSGSSGSGNFAEHFGETCLSGSLEDLVNTFDESVTKCCKNYEEQVERLAPVQVRTQDDVIADCQ